MKVVVLIDNNPHPSETFATEHGLSIYFEKDGKKWLLDVGASEQYYTNAQQMGISITDVDFLVLSHGHADHTGGLKHFLQNNNKATVLASVHMQNKLFFSYRRGPKRDISTDLSLFSTYADRFHFVADNEYVSQGVAIISKFPNMYDRPKANQKLTISDAGVETKDPFLHELALMVKTSAGIVVLSACAHNGLLNTLAACKAYSNTSLPIITYIGGTHLMNPDDSCAYESGEELNRIASTLESDYPNIHFYTGHCTGDQAIRHLSSSLKNKLTVFYSGITIQV